MRLRPPRWLVEALAWTSAVVLLTALVLVGTGTVHHRTAPAQADTPVLRDDGPVSPSPTPRTGAPAPVTRQGGARLSAPTIASLGPPPGPLPQQAPAQVADPAHRWALLVGITRYTKPTHDTLAGANDVGFVRQMLLNAGWLDDHVRVLTNAQATAAAMRADLSWLAARSVPGTFVLFHYSGHVRQGGGHENLWPYDNHFIRDDQLAATFRGTSGKVWLDIAGCEAAGFMEDLPSDRVLVSTSSKSTQKSYEHPQWGESIWVGLMWDAGLYQRKADLDHNGVVTIGESLRFAAYWAQVVTFYQRPHGKQSPQVAGMPVRGWTLSDPPA